MGNLIVVLLAMLVGECWAQGSFMELDKEIRTMIVNDHNDKRREEKTACQMNAMAYSMELEKVAKDWISSCQYRHQNRGYGENLARFSSKKNATGLVQWGFSMWHGEKSDYQPDQTNCYDSCHYTQIIWWRTKLVGCGLIDCVKNKIFACFYKQGGNVQGQKPYPTKCDTPCTEGQTLKDGLCYDKDYKTIVDYPTTTVETTTRELTTTTTTTEATTKDDCKDTGNNCEQRVANGGCTKTKVMAMCKKSCNAC